MSAENGIGTAGRLHAVDETPKKSGIGWPKGRIPFPRTKKDPENARKRRSFRGISTTCGEIAGIAAVSVGTGWYSFGAGLIVAGVGVFAVSFVSGMPE